MWPWMKRWRDWAMRDLWPLTRFGPQPQALHYSYEKAGLTLYDQPIPWNAEAVLVEASVRLSSGASRRKADFHLRIPDREPELAESLRRQEGEDRYRIVFRLPPLTATTCAQVLWRDHVLGELTLPFLSREDFIQNLRLQLPTSFVRLGEDTVACQTFVSTQCKGLIIHALLASPTSLVPLLDLDLQVEIRSERGTAAQLLPARLCSSQLSGRQAAVTVVPRRFPRRVGAWGITWLLGSRPLASHRIRAITQRQFQKSLRVSDTRFLIQYEKHVSVSRQLPVLESPGRAGPCFLICSREPGMAGLCTFHVRAQVPGTVQQPLLMEQETLITDGPTAVAPGTMDAADLRQITSFEVCLKGQVLGVLPLSPAPTANFTSEGAFKQPHDFSWSGGAEDELNERLNRLLEGKGKGE